MSEGAQLESPIKTSRRLLNEEDISVEIAEVEPTPEMCAAFRRFMDWYTAEIMENACVGLDSQVKFAPLSEALRE